MTLNSVKSTSKYKSNKFKKNQQIHGVQIQWNSGALPGFKEGSKFGIYSSRTTIILSLIISIVQGVTFLPNYTQNRNYQITKEMSLLEFKKRRTFTSSN